MFELVRESWSKLHKVKYFILDYSNSPNLICVGSKSLKKEHKMELHAYTFLRGIRTKRPTKQTKKRKPIIQPSPGSLILVGEFPSVLIPASSYVFLFNPTR